VALLLGYGASAVCPYLTFASVDDMVRDGRHGLPTTMEPERPGPTWCELSTKAY